MDRLLGWIIDDYILFRILDVIIFMLILAAIYLAIQNILTWKFLKKGDINTDELISNRGSFYKMLIFLFITGFFMLIHKFLEGFEENVPDDTTFHFFQLMALLGLVLFMLEWYKISKKLKRKQNIEIGQ
ncbi:MAG: hypothetical protein OIN90_09595, partial [Candidatus Methanoperedens sp.]|nr:hypothetical protein [Candidatus Methanoperedens sp.]